MAQGNRTGITEFIFLGLTDQLQWQIILFMLFLLYYLVTLVGNLGLIAPIGVDSRLRSPMYFFLSHLAFVDTCSSSTVVPKMLTDFFKEKKTISFLGCAAQMWFFGLFVAAECFLFSAMAFDRYVAIRNPLLYRSFVSPEVRVRLAVAPYVLGFLSTTTHTTSTFRLPFCGPDVINHYFCDIAPLLALVCADVQASRWLLFISAGTVGVSSGLAILVSYLYILVAVSRIRSATGRRKAFSTCSSHLTAVAVLYGTLFFIYVRPGASLSLHVNKVVSVFYTAIIPMLNPLIYSLRNKEVKDALCWTLQRKMVLYRTYHFYEHSMKGRYQETTLVNDSGLTISEEALTVPGFDLCEYHCSTMRSCED
ncbi:olfactory receptor 1009-like [Ornithorhynchus anatinus]|uniref:olfactory receptor 1009-like n=1 Tax=Ornithorhynchus anatinus TaxID=9258 RepID=UPI0010A84272|nr:olfactory receptor 1009-like [Ornithorhynchus anatinus]